MARALDRRLQDCRLIADYSLSCISPPARKQLGVDSICSAATMLDRALDFIALRFSFTVWSRCRPQRQFDQLAAQLGHLLRRRQAACAVAQAYVAQAAPDFEFSLIVGLMASVSLVSSIASKSFEDKALRGATVQVGSELHVSISPTDLVSAEQLEQGLGGQVQAIRAVLKERLAAFQNRP